MSRFTIHILAPTDNERGDLFARITQAFFSSLGYQDFRLNVHKSGREIDIHAEHHLEHRGLVAECKAHSEPMGGGEINKFVGVLDVEKHRAQGAVVGYFVSLSGFRETAVEQEREVGNKRVILVTGDDLIERLITGNGLVPISKAYSAAGTCAGNLPLTPDPEYALVLHRLGLIWAIYYTQNKERTHFSLVHADGQALARVLADQIIASDGAPFGSLTYLAPPTLIFNNAQVRAAATAAYLSYVEAECGEIQLEGMPADQEVGSRRLRLESIFVPSHLVSLEEDSPDNGEGKSSINAPDENPDRIAAGEVLKSTKCVAILGLPGSGKSTLLKRLGTAYGVPSRKALVGDDLPDEALFPLFIRCRQLGEKARSPITEILSDIPSRVELDSSHREAFMQVVEGALREGRAILLVDGLDEISDAASRLAFVKQMRVFLIRYPAISLVLTSREAGFRVVGSALDGVVRKFALDAFDEEDVTRLTLAWHKEVVGDKPDVKVEAEKLARSIVGAPRVMQLASNPLLLTTLLLVKRWVGSLPTKRTVYMRKLSRSYLPHGMLKDIGHWSKMKYFAS